MNLMVQTLNSSFFLHIKCLHKDMVMFSLLWNRPHYKHNFPKILCQAVSPPKSSWLTYFQLTVLNVRLTHIKLNNWMSVKDRYVFHRPSKWHPQRQLKNNGTGTLNLNNQTTVSQIYSTTQHPSTQQIFECLTLNFTNVKRNLNFLTTLIFPYNIKMVNSKYLHKTISQGSSHHTVSLNQRVINVKMNQLQRSRFLWGVFWLFLVNKHSRN